MVIYNIYNYEAQHFLAVAEVHVYFEKLIFHYIIIGVEN